MKDEGDLHNDSIKTFNKKIYTEFTALTVEPSSKSVLK